MFKLHISDGAVKYTEDRVMYGYVDYYKSLSSYQYLLSINKLTPAPIVLQLAKGITLSSEQFKIFISEYFKDLIWATEIDYNLLEVLEIKKLIESKEDKYLFWQ